METSGLTYGRFTTVLVIVAALWLLLSCVPVQPTEPALEPTPTPNAGQWREAMPHLPAPKAGCFTSEYPNTEWQEVPCSTAPPIPMPPRRGPRPLVVGAGNDISAQAPTGFISTAIGSFDSVTGVTSVSSPIGNSGSPVANAYTLQLNTDFFASTTCSGADDPAQCSGWQQFVFANDGSSGVIFIQYWLLNYNTTCPSGWNQFSFTGASTIYCWKNSSRAVAVPHQPISNLAQLTLSGAVSASEDRVTLTVGTTAYSMVGDNSVNAAAGWRIAEFNVFGYGGNEDGGGQASFNSGSTIVPRTRAFYGGTSAPFCSAQGFTGETNNLSFGPSAPAASAPGPAVLFTQSSAGGAVSNCAAAVTVGDTHLATFHGLFYDFQASGDFVLAEVDPNFVVQARQVSGAPKWPNASVNSAIATQMDKTQVAVCLTPPEAEMPVQLFIDGNPTPLSDGESLSLPDGADVTRVGNVYVIRDQSGNSVRAIVKDGWIDASVGLGQWPSEVRGLLANANGDVNAIETRDGEVLTNPFSFDTHYGYYAESWRVPPAQSLLSVCGAVKDGIPEEPFYAEHLAELNPEEYAKARDTCIEAGVKEDALLDACTIDVAVIGKPEAADVFVDLTAPVAVGIVR